MEFERGVMKRFKTKYPGVFYREADRIGGKGIEQVFYVIFKKDGKNQEEKVGRQYADAMTAAKAARIRGERIEGRRFSKKEIREQQKEKALALTIDKLFEKFKKEKTHKSIETDKSRFNTYLSPYVGAKEPQNLLPLDIERLTKKALKGKSPQTIKHTLVLLRRLVNFGVKQKVSQQMTFQIDMPKVNNIVIEDLNQKQIAKLMKAIESDPYPEVAAVMSIALFTGMRRGEILSLQWDDIDFDRGFISIKNPKGGQNATIPLSDAALQILKRLSQSKGPYVFPGKDGQKKHDIRRGSIRIKKAAGLPKNFRPLHGLRHVFASMLASSGQVDLFTLQKLLTHKDPKTTQRYAHLRDDSLRQAANLAGTIIKSDVQNQADEEMAEG